jgi:hypothetical protein
MLYMTQEKAEERISSSFTASEEVASAHGLKMEMRRNSGHKSSSHLSQGFGYAAFYLAANSSSELNITDFAKSLLAALKNEPERALGQVSSSTSACMRLTNLEKAPIIFVAHSLGGLVVKKVFRGDLGPFLS